MNKFPKNTGLTGECFMNNRVIIGNEKEVCKFTDIDHVAISGGIKNFAFLPLYGYSTEIVGVLELINKKDGQVMAKNDILEIEPYRKCIGLMMKHITELNSTMSASFTLKKLIGRIDINIAGLEKDVFLNFVLIRKRMMNI